MRIVGEKEALADAGQAVLRVVAARATLPVLGGIRISASDDGVEFAGTDLEIFVRVRGDFSVEEAGVSVVPGRLFGEIVRSLPSGTVTINGSESEIRVEGGRSEFSLSALPTADFPETPEISEASDSRVAGSELARALRQVVRAASTDEARPVLTGVLWAAEGGSLRLVATDSYRLAVRELVVKEGPSEGSAIVPGRALGEFGRHLAGIGEGEAEIRLGESQVEFLVGRTRLVSRLIEGEFPNYRQLLPEGYKNRLSVSRDAFLEAVERVGLVAQANTPLRLHLEDEIKVTAIESGVAEGWEAVADAQYSGEPMVAAFNPRFLADGLEALDTERAVLEFSDPLKPALVKGEGRDDYVYLVMPVRLPRQ
jgi:DNA polymerase III subunit beta